MALALTKEKVDLGRQELRLPPSRMVLVDSGSPFVLHLTFLLCVMNVLQGRGDVVYVDGGNSLNPHTVASIARRYGLPRSQVLQSLHVARAFTAHQMAALVVEEVEAAVADADASLLVLSCLPELFLDEEVPGDEAYHLLQRSLGATRELTRSRNTVTVVTNLGLARLHRRRSLRNLLYRSVDRLIHVQAIRGGVRLRLPEKGLTADYAPAPPNQMTLDDFRGDRTWPWRAVG
jgi:hypothetical protein